MTPEASPTTSVTSAVQIISILADWHGAARGWVAIGAEGIAADGSDEPFSAKLVRYSASSTGAIAAADHRGQT